MGFRTWFGGVRAKIRKALGKLPPLEVVWRERRAYAAALLALGDKAQALEPEQIADLEYVRLAARAAQFVADASGEEKLQEVVSTLRAAWGAVGIADRVFDTWWIDYGRPFLDAYVREVKAADAWIPPA